MSRWHPTYEQVAELLSYDEFSGIITWDVPWGKMVAGQRAGTLDSKGYLRIGVLCRRFRAHRIAWLLHYREWPKGRLDHKNGVRTDNRISNLRIATPAQNNQNRKVSKANKSGLLGAHSSWGGKFKSEIAVGGVRFQLGIFTTAEDAHEAYCIAKRVLHKFNPHIRPADKLCDGFAGELSRELGIRFFKGRNGVSLPRPAPKEASA